MKRKLFLRFGIFLGMMSGIICPVVVAAEPQGEIVMEVGGRPPLQEPVHGEVEGVLGEAIPNNIKEPLLNRVRNGLIVVEKDRMQALADLGLDHVERIGRQGRMATGTVTRIYKNNMMGNELSKIGQFVCDGNNVNLPEGAQPVSGQGYFVKAGQGPAGGGAPSNKHPNAPRIGNQIPKNVLKKMQDNAAGKQGGGHIGRAPDMVSEATNAGVTFNLRFQSAQDGYKSNPGELPVNRTKEGIADEIDQELSEKLEKPDDLSANADIGSFPQSDLTYRWQKTAGHVFAKILISMPDFFHTFALENGKQFVTTRDMVRGVMEARNKWNLGKQNPENLATQQLSGMYWSLGIQDRIDSAASLMEQQVDTERAQIRTLSSLVNALFIEANRANGVLSVEGRSKSLGDIKGQSVINTAR